MMQRPITLTLAVILSLVGFVWVARGYLVDQQRLAISGISKDVGKQIPFNFNVSRVAGPYCDPLDVELLIFDTAGDDIEYRWRAMDGRVVQLACDDFYDLYYRCDAPPCINLRIATIDTYGHTESVRFGHVCLD